MPLRNGTRVARKSETMNDDESARPTRVSAHEPSTPNHMDTGDTQLGRRIRDLSARFMREVLRALATASATEIGQLLARSGGASLKRAVKARTFERTFSSPRKISMRSAPAPEPETHAPIVPHDPFAITSPGELLAPREEIAPRPSEPPPSERTAPTRAVALLETRPATDSSTTLRDVDADAASERRPKVVLRAGEHLLSATGSGVVIRRERRIVPKEST